VPQTKLKSEYMSPTQPFPTFFKPYVRQRLTEADLFKEGISEESYRDLVQRFRSLDNDNMWNPPSARGTIQNPGLYGGGGWGGPAFDPETEILYINANESPWVIGPRIADDQNSSSRQTNQTNPEVGKSLYQKNCAGCHGADRKGGGAYPSLVGMPLDEASFSSLIYTGKGTMPRFPHLSGAERIASFVLDLKDKRGQLFVSSADEELPEYYRIPYREGRGGKFLTKEGYHGVKPPWGHLSAIDLNTGEVLWKQTIGDYPELKAQGNPRRQRELRSACRHQRRLGVYRRHPRREDPRVQQENRRVALGSGPAGRGIATPAVYEVNGKEFIVIACGGGGKQRTKSGDQYVAFALPDASGAAKRSH